MDRLTRPSVEHVIRVQDEAGADDRAGVGGDKAAQGYPCIIRTIRGSLLP